MQVNQLPRSFGRNLKRMLKCPNCLDLSNGAGVGVLFNICMIYRFYNKSVACQIFLLQKHCGITA